MTFIQFSTPRRTVTVQQIEAGKAGGQCTACGQHVPSVEEAVRHVMACTSHKR